MPLSMAEAYSQASFIYMQLESNHLTPEDASKLLTALNARNDVNLETSVDRLRAHQLKSLSKQVYDAMAVEGYATSSEDDPYDDYESSYASS